MRALIHPQSVKWVLPLVAVLMLTTVVLLSYPDLRQSALPSPHPIVYFTQPKVAGFLIHTSGCRIPLMKAFEPAIKKYLKKSEPISCSKEGPLILSNQTSLWINAEHVRAKNKEEEEVKCCFQAMWRKVMDKYEANELADSNIILEDHCHSFNNSVNIYDEIVKVSCSVNDTIIHKDYHSFIVPKPNKEDHKISKLPLELKPSVLIIGVDAVSRLNFYRQMPKTLKFLQDMKAIELLGYNKVDDNTFPNLVPVLTGNSVDELRKTCWNSDDDVFDDCGFVWKNYSGNGYRTAFGEDACWMGIFQYVKKGFFRQPVDYYLHTMMSRSEQDIGHEKKLNAKLCVGPRLAAEVLFDYAEKLAVNLTESNNPFFGFFWGTSLTHDYLNVPPQGDDIHENLLLNLKENNVLNRTVVIVMSDHGIRWGPIRETYQGRVEERLPMVFLLLPDWFKEMYRQATSNLRRNRNMLTSPFDVHETLLDLLDLSSLTQERLEERRKLLSTPRGISLFLPVPESRTCEDAGITDNWCTCHQSQNVSTDEPIVSRAAQTIVNFVNQKLFQYIQCSQLTLHEVRSAEMEAPRKEVKEKTERAMRDLTVVLVTTPGLAEFEATVRHQLHDDSLTVLGYVSRINTYGSQSRCVDDFHMKLYCYCF